MGTSQINQGTQQFFNNLGSAITNDIGAPGNLINSVSGLINGLSNFIPVIGIVAGLYIISTKL